MNRLYRNRDNSGHAAFVMAFVRRLKAWYETAGARGKPRCPEHFTLEMTEPSEARFIDALFIRKALRANG